MFTRFLATATRSPESTSGGWRGEETTNIIPKKATLHGEVRRENLSLHKHVENRVKRTLTGAATLHGCDVTIDFGDGAPSADCDDMLVETGSDLATDRGLNVVPDVSGYLGGSEDATKLMRRFQRDGGSASYIGFGADNEHAHHSSRFDIDETSISIGVNLIFDTLEAILKDGSRFAELILPPALPRGEGGL